MNDNREKDDFYPTPPQAVLPLLPHLELIGNTQYDVWECACGDGAISKVLEENGLNVRSTDLIDRGYGQPNIDFLMETKANCNWIVTNPPYKLANEFVLKCLDLLHYHEELIGFAMLLRLAYLEGQTRRRSIYDVHAPAEVLVFSERLTMIRGDHEEAWYGSGKIAFCWMVWRRDKIDRTNLSWI